MIWVLTEIIFNNTAGNRAKDIIIMVTVSEYLFHEYS